MSKTNSRDKFKRSSLKFQRIQDVPEEIRNNNLDPPARPSQPVPSQSLKAQVKTNPGEPGDRTPRFRVSVPLPS